jgi:hypothetical protein
MKRFEHIGFLLIATVLLLLLAIFPILTFDAVGKLLSRIAALEPGNLVLLLYLELSRAFTTIVAIGAALYLVMRSSRHADGRALALFLMFSALTYEKIFGTTGYPGPLQEKFTIALLNAGVSRDFLLWLFGPVPWSLWLALAAALRFSVVFPHPPLSAEAIDDSGRTDRRGMLRGAGVAGLDIGAAFRGVAKRALQIGALRPLPLWTSAVLLIVVTTLVGPGARAALFAIAASLVTALAITNLRASYNVIDEAEKKRMRWLMLGFAIGGSLFLIAALPLLFFDDPVANIPALVLLMVAPTIIMVCMALGVVYKGPADAGEMLERVPGAAALALVVLLVFAVTLTSLSALATRVGLSRSLVVLATLVITALLFEPLRRGTERMVNRILERPQQEVLS